VSGGWMPEMFRAGPGGELPVVSVTRMPPELGGKREHPRPEPRGEPGYGGAPGDPEFIAGSVTGYRWWALAADGRLLGMHDAWTPGENHARCLADRPGHHLVRGAGQQPGPGLQRPLHPAADVPAEACFCGFYAYWTVPGQMVPGTLLPVLGVIEGYGKVLIGSKGFRCATAKIMALCPLGSPVPGPVAAMGRAYPGARVYRSLDGMCGEFPPDPGYAR
jgi:hypothetical protein